MFAGVPVVYGNVDKLSAKAKEYVAENVKLCKPDNLHVCDGSDEEGKHLINLMLQAKLVEPLPKYKNCWLVHTDPADVARVEEKTYICTPEERESHPILKPGVKGKLGNWISPADLEKAVKERFPGCMKENFSSKPELSRNMHLVRAFAVKFSFVRVETKMYSRLRSGRTMFVIPFSMGPVGSHLSKIGIELTDSPYVVTCMRIMTRIGNRVLETLGNGHFIKCLHSVGAPYPLERPLRQHWPCNPEKTIILHLPHNDEIISFGSGYGGNSLLGKKCFALRIGSTIARNEGWLAEHMLILGVTNAKGQKKYITGAFPSACGKTNLAMITPVLKGYKAECVGDDIAWMRFDHEGVLRGINPENGFFGVAPGTSWKSNPIAMSTIFKNSVFTNVAKTSDGGVYWEGMGEELPRGVTITSWLQEPWTPGCGKPVAHPNSRFTSPCRECPIMDPLWEDSKGVPICALLFGGRRPQGVPLIYEAFDWTHGVFIAACMKSEATAAAEFHGKEIMHDPFAMRPFFGYNFGHYLGHWLSFQKKPGLKLPRIFHVNWFRVDKNGKFLWPGFGDNSRVLDWILRRLDGEDVAQKSPIGWIPKPGSINLEGLENQHIDMDELFRIPKDYWLEDIEENRQYFQEQVGVDLPKEIWAELDKLKKRIEEMP